MMLTPIKIPKFRPAIRSEAVTTWILGRLPRGGSAGLIEKLERKLEQHRADLTHIDGVLRLLQPDRDPADIKPKRTYARRTRYFARNELSRLCMDALRTADGTLMTTDDIACRIIKAKG